MNKANSIFFYLAMAFFVIGTHQALVYSIADAYGIFMLSIGLLLLYTFQKRKESETSDKPKKGKPKAGKSAKRR